MWYEVVAHEEAHQDPVIDDPLQVKAEWQPLLDRHRGAGGAHNTACNSDIIIIAHNCTLMLSEVQQK